MRNLALSLLVLLAAVVFTVRGTADEPSADHGHHAHAFEHCAKACEECQRACSSCATHCAHLLAQGKKEHHTTLQTCLDCADHCSTAARITARQGVFSDLICNACAEACSRCGKECAKQEDEHMKKCAEECRKCEKACREMLKHLEKGSPISK